MTDTQITEALVARILGPNPADARADSIRMDWLESKRPTIDTGIPRCLRFYRDDRLVGFGPTFRSAIDCGMDAEAADGEEMAHEADTGGVPSA